MQLPAQLKEHAAYEDRILTENKQAVSERNLKILRFILLAGIVVFSVTLLSTSVFKNVSSTGYLHLKSAYFILIISAGAAYTFLSLYRSMISAWAIYFIYTLLFVYCMITSAWISPNYVSVVILALLFQIPILYLDRSVRINLFVTIGAASYLLFISRFKRADILVDEVVNVLGFTTVAIIIGNSVRGSILENFVMKATLSRYAYTDPLTGLANRRRLFEYLSDEKNRCYITGFALLDIDYFKSYNDTYGHQAGDDCLRKIADCLLEFQDTYNLLACRYGGEEFLLVFQDYSRADLLKIAVDIRSRIEQMHLTHENTRAGIVTVSIGTSVYHYHDHMEYTTSISYADKALYAVKNQSRNAVAYYDSCMNICVLEQNF